MHAVLRGVNESRAVLRSTREHGPADAISYPLIVDNELTNRVRKLLALPAAFFLTGLFGLVCRRGCTDGLDGVCGGAELVGCDVRHQGRLCGRVCGESRRTLVRPGGGVGSAA